MGEVKTCERCGKEQWVSRFARDASSADGRQRACRDCHREMREWRGYRHRKKRRAGTYKTPTLLTCTRCGKDKHASDFRRDEDSKTGRGTRCKACVAAWSAYQRRRRLAQEEAERLYVAQNKIYAPRKNKAKKHG